MNTFINQFETPKKKFYTHKKTNEKYLYVKIISILKLCMLSGV